MPRVSYVISDELLAQCDKIPVLKRRVTNLIQEFNFSNKLIDFILI